MADPCAWCLVKAADAVFGSEAAASVSHADCQCQIILLHAGESDPPWLLLLLGIVARSRALAGEDATDSEICYWLRRIEPDLMKDGVQLKPRNPPGSGSVTVPEELKPKPYQHEIDAAHRLAEKGFTVTFIEASNKKKVRSPDILLDGVKWEIKSPTGTGERTIDNKMHDAEGQSSRLILDLTNYPRSDEYALAEVKRRLYSRVKLSKVLIILSNGNLALITR